MKTPLISIGDNPTHIFTRTPPYPPSECAEDTRLKQAECARVKIYPGEPLTKGASSGKSDDLIIPVLLVIKSIPGERPPAIRARLAAKQAKRQHNVLYRAYLGRDELAALQATYDAYDLSNLEPIETNPNTGDAGKESL